MKHFLLFCIFVIAIPLTFAEGHRSDRVNIEVKQTRLEVDVPAYKGMYNRRSLIKFTDEVEGQKIVCYAIASGPDAATTPSCLKVGN